MKSEIVEVVTPDRFRSKTHRITDSIPIDAGTMGAVYRAENTLSGERVCVKLSAPNQAAIKKMGRRGLTPADEVAKEAGHGSAFLITSRPYLTLDGVAYIEMPELRGNLQTYLVDNKGKISFEQKIQLLMDLTQGVVDQHQMREETHGDIRAKNVLMGKRIKGLDRLVLADTGNASAIDSTTTDPRDNMGHWSTTAPELTHQGSRPTLETDFYSAGAVMYEIIIGRLPLESILIQAKEPRQFLRESPPQDLSGYIKADIDQNCPKPFREMFYRLLNPDKSFRPHTDEEFQKIVARGISKYEKSKPMSRLKRWSVMALTTIALAGGVRYTADNQNSKEILIKQLEDNQKSLSLSQRLGNIRLYATGSTGFDTSGMLANKIIRAWEEKFWDKKTAFAAYLNPQIVFDAITELRLPTNAPIRYESIQDYVKEHDQETYATMFMTLGLIDNFVYSSDFEGAFIEERWSEARTDYTKRKTLEAQQKTNNYRFDERGKKRNIDNLW